MRRKTDFARETHHEPNSDGTDKEKAKQFLVRRRNLSRAILHLGIVLFGDENQNDQTRAEKYAANYFQIWGEGNAEVGIEQTEVEIEGHGAQCLANCLACAA